jgi:hypothetical protein
VVSRFIKWFMSIITNIFKPIGYEYHVLGVIIAKNMNVMNKTDRGGGPPHGELEGDERA